ncbi:MAG: hypothetical protein Q9218_005298 [Villophora microphyllina]
MLRFLGNMFTANIQRDVPYVPKSSTTKMAPQDSRKGIRSAVEEVDRISSNDAEEGADTGDITLLASGGYNDIWLTQRRCLTADQVRNEIAWLKYVKARLPSVPSVPVPSVYDYNFASGSAQDVFIAEEFIDGDRLSDIWSVYDEPTKLELARQIAGVVVDLGFTTFEGIGGLMPDGTLGPTVEGMKLFKGRVGKSQLYHLRNLIENTHELGQDKFHSPTCYNIGPYSSTKQYVLACYDKEIHYYTHAPECDIDWDLFETVSRETFISTLESEERAIEQDASAFAPEKPFVLVHGDLHGRNIMVKDGRVNAILDWEFAGAYPLSELPGGMGVDVLEADDEDSVEACAAWSRKIGELAGQLAMQRGWMGRRESSHADVNPELQKVRVEIFP